MHSVQTATIVTTFRITKCVQKTVIDQFNCLHTHTHTHGTVLVNSYPHVDNPQVTGQYHKLASAT